MRISISALIVLASGAVDVHSFGVALRPAVAARGRLATPARAARVHSIRASESASSSVAEYTNAGRELPLAAKEKLFLDSIAAFYNDEKSLLDNDDYERLKMDLEFEASKYVTMSRDELKFVIASSRYREGKPIMNDAEYDALRKELKSKNSPAVIHDAPTCKVDSGICKSDASPDQGKNLVLYLPGTVASAVLWTELLYWTKGWDPLLAAIFGSPLIYLGARLITEKILFQNPLVVSTTCPSCSSVINLYFGDVLGVNNENMMATEHECPVCKAKLTGNRETMIVETPAKTV